MEPLEEAEMLPLLDLLCECRSAVCIEVDEAGGLVMRSSMGLACLLSAGESISSRKSG